MISGVGVCPGARVGPGVASSSRELSPGGLNTCDPSVRVCQQVVAAAKVADDDDHRQRRKYAPVENPPGLAMLAACKSMHDRRKPPDADQEHDRDCRQSDAPVGEELRREDYCPPPERVDQQKHTATSGGTAKSTAARRFRM